MVMIALIEEISCTHSIAVKSSMPMIFISIIVVSITIKTILLLSLNLIVFRRRNSNLWNLGDMLCSVSWRLIISQWSSYHFEFIVMVGVTCTGFILTPILLILGMCLCITVLLSPCIFRMIFTWISFFFRTHSFPWTTTLHPKCF